MRMTVIGMLLGASCIAAAYADPADEPYGAEAGRGTPAVTRIQTMPRMLGETAEDKARSYRACLFTFLPRVGSDVAAGLIRDACHDEYLR